VAVPIFWKACLEQKASWVQDDEGLEMPPRCVHTTTKIQLAIYYHHPFAHNFTMIIVQQLAARL
jgi:hypothetical protein